jgi:hypothetical protein
MLAKGVLPNLIGGISQQDPVLRLANQSAHEVNTFPVIVDGNKKRPPTEHIAAIADTPLSAYSHFMIRDRDEQYCLTISDGVLRVNALDGSSKTVTTPSGTDYLETPGGVDDAANFEALTIADYTLIVNKSVETALDAAVVSPTRKPEAIINILAGNYGKTYNVVVNGVLHGSITAPNGSASTDANFTDTAFLAGQLTAQMTGLPVPGVSGGAFGSGGSTNGVTGSLTVANGWNVVQIGNAIWVERLTGVDFQIEVQDGYNGNAMKMVKSTTQYFTDLPNFAPEGFVVAIQSNTNKEDSTYYVRFWANNGVSGQGFWKECPKQNSVLAFDATTMPHKLVRNADGTFTFDEIAWDQMIAGDTTTNPPPSFIGKTISDISFFANRVCLFAGQNVSTSRAGDFFNLWRTSAVTLLDTDPIDVNAASQKVAKLRAGTMYQKKLIVWSDFEQFAFGGNELLTPKTVHMKPITPFENLAAQVRPVETPRRILFCADRNSYTAVREWYTDSVVELGMADEATAHVPTLIPSGAYKMAVSNSEDILGLLTTEDRSAMYVHKFFWSEQQKLQAAWIKWTFGTGTILNAEFVSSTLYLLINRDGTTYLEKMRVNPMLTDNGVAAILLDRRVSDLSGSYNATTDQTTYTLPYGISADASLEAASQSFVTAPIFSAEDDTVVMSGDQTAVDWYFGEAYEMSYRFSPMFVRQAAADGRSSTIQEGRLQLLKLDISYANAVSFNVEVTPPGRPTRTYTFDQLFLDEDGSDVNSVSPGSGVFSVPVKAQSDYVDITIRNDSPFPANFTRAEWSGNFVPKSRK